MAETSISLYDIYNALEDSCGRQEFKQSYFPFQTVNYDFYVLEDSCMKHLFKQSFFSLFQVVNYDFYILGNS